MRYLWNLDGCSQGRVRSQVRREAEHEKLAEVRFWSAAHTFLDFIMKAMGGFYQGKDVIQYAEKDHSGHWIQLRSERVLIDISS